MMRQTYFPQLTDARYGEEVPTNGTTAPVGGAAPVDAGAVMQGVGLVTGVVGGIVMGGAAREDRPDVIAKNQTIRFIGAMNEYTRLQVEFEQARAWAAQAEAWLLNPTVKIQWMTGGPAMRTAPGGRRMCPPLAVPLDPIIFPGAPIPEPTENPGGHAFGNPECRCKTSPCAYKQRDRVEALVKQAQMSDMQRKMFRILHSRAPVGDVKIGLAAGTGNFKQVTREAKTAWSMLMALDGMSSLFTASTGMMTAWAGGLPSLYSAQTLNRLYGTGSYDVRSGMGEPNPDAVAGRVPIEVSERSLSMGVSMYGMGLFPSSYTLPLWVYGFTAQEIRDFGGIGPNIGQVVTVQNQSQSSSATRNAMRQLIVSGNINKVSASSPAAVPNANLATLQAQAALVTGELGEGAAKATRNKRILYGGVGIASLLLLGGIVALARR